MPKPHFELEPPHSHIVLLSSSLSPSLSKLPGMVISRQSGLTSRRGERGNASGMPQTESTRRNAKRSSIPMKRTKSPEAKKREEEDEHFNRPKKSKLVKTPKPAQQSKKKGAQRKPSKEVADSRILNWKCIGERATASSANSNRLRWAVAEHKREKKRSHLVQSLHDIYNRSIPGIERSLPGHLYKVITAEGTRSIVGRHNVHGIVAGLTFSLFESEHYGLICSLKLMATERQFRENRELRVGSYAMRYLKEYLIRCMCCEHILVWASNTAVGFYEKQGFVTDIPLAIDAYSTSIGLYTASQLMYCRLDQGASYCNDDLWILDAQVQPNLTAVKAKREEWKPRQVTQPCSSELSETRKVLNKLKGYPSAHYFLTRVHYTYIAEQSRNKLELTTSLRDIEQFLTSAEAGEMDPYEVNELHMDLKILMVEVQQHPVACQAFLQAATALEKYCEELFPLVEEAPTKKAREAKESGSKAAEKGMAKAAKKTGPTKKAEKTYPTAKGARPTESGAKLGPSVRGKRL